MKDTDNATKKLIKNGISLLVSALVLIAATVAWFTTGGRVGADEVSARISNDEINLNYYKATVPSTDCLDWDNSDLVVHTSTQTVTVSDYLDDASGWTSVSSLDLEDLYPGQLQVYRIDFTASIASSVFNFFGVDCTPAAEAENIFKSVYVEAKATITHEGTQSAVAPTSGSFYDLLDGTETAEILDLTTAQANDTISIYYMIGIPGTDTEGTHDVLRQLGASINIGTVGLTDPNASPEEVSTTAGE